jgi:DNA-binding NarL/FixJ family response regulator
MTSVLIIDESPLIQLGVAAVLATVPTEFTVVGTTGDRGEALQLAQRRSPAVIVLGTGSRHLGGLQPIRVFLRWVPRAAVIVLSAEEDDETRFYAMMGGAAAHLPATAAPESLLDTVRRVARGEVLLERDDPARTPLTSGHLPSNGQGETALATTLTPRQHEILTQLAHGLTNKEIAAVLGISDQTVKNHLAAIMQKMGTADRTQVVVQGLRAGWITL